MNRLLAVGLILFSASAASGQSIGVYTDSGGTDCRITVPFPGSPVRVFVVAKLDGLAPDGATNALFRISGLPEGWTTRIVETPLAAAIIGHAFTEGVVLAYSTCLTATPMVLMQIEITPSSLVENVSLSVLAHRDDPGDCGFESNRCGPCPKFCGCGDLFTTCYCTQGVVSTINGDSCSLQLSPRCWGAVKALYQ